jgi:hypothetical protein
MTQKQQRKQPHQPRATSASPRPKPPRRRPTVKRRRRKLVQPMTTGNAVLDAWLLTARPLAEQYELQEFVWPDDMRDRP